MIYRNDFLNIHYTIIDDLAVLEFSLAYATR